MRWAVTATDGAAAAARRLSCQAPDSRDKCVILFGTQTGTAERFAKSLRAQLEGRYGGSTAFEVLDIEQYDAPAQLPREKLAFLLMATYGDGDPTDSATDFWTWLSEAAEGGGGDGLLAGLSFGVFGLGNRQYEHFCAMGRKVSKAMRQLGADEAVARGEGDDDRDIDEDFDRWCSQLFAALDASGLVTAGKVGCCWGAGWERRRLGLGGAGCWARAQLAPAGPRSWCWHARAGRGSAGRAWARL